MSEPEIPDLLDRAAARVEVGPPPIGAMLRDASRVRRRRRVGLVAAAAAVVTVIGGTAYVVGSPDDGPSPQDPVVAPDEPTIDADASRVPDGYRLVAVGSAAIAVPADWGTNKVQCGDTPTQDTVVIDLAVLNMCARERPRGVESVNVGHGSRTDVARDLRTYEIDGHRVEVEETTCAERAFIRGGKRDRGDVVCSATLWFADLDASFSASSSTQPEATARANVEEILSHVLVLDDEVGVPEFQEVTTEGQERGGERYVKRLEEAGLRAEVVTEQRPGMKAGFVLGVDPAPGTVVAPGSTVQVTVIGEPQGPADELSVGMNSDATDWDPDALDSLQIRANPTVRIKVGDGIWAYAHGKRARTLAGALDGDSLEIDGWTDGPNFPHSWRAVRPGRTTITLTITADGEEVVLGRVTVVVTS